MSKKISKKYWDTLREFEQNYVSQRVNVTTIPEIKMIISDARKQYPDFVKIYGKGFIELPNGDVRLWTGDMTRRFQLVKNGSIVIEY